MTDVLNMMLLITAFVGAVLLLLAMIGANIYDFKQAEQRRDYLLHPRARRYRQRPWISAVVHTQNQAELLEQTVASLAISSYRKLEIIIVDNASQDGMKQVVKTLAAAYPKRNIKLLSKRAEANRQQAMAQAYRAYGRGDLVLQCEAGQTLAKQAVTTALRHHQLNAESGETVVILNQLVATRLSVIGLLQKYEHLLRYRVKKTRSLLGLEAGVDPREVTLSHSKAFLNSAAKRQPVIAPSFRYAADALTYATPAASLDDLLQGRYQLQLARWRSLAGSRQQLSVTRQAQWFRLSISVLIGSLALLLPLLFGYFVYLAVSLQQPLFFVLSLIVLTGVMVLVIWGDEHLMLRDKISYTMGIPLTYGLFCLLSLIQPLVLLRAMLDGQRQGQATALR